MTLVIRRYRPSDKDAVRSLFSDGIREHIRPAFYNAVRSQLYVGVTLCLGLVGFLMGCVSGALVLVAGWLGLVYYCCHDLYASFVNDKLHKDMQDIPGSYLSRPDDCFWVAEVEGNGKSQVMGMVAVVGKQSGGEKHGELFRMIISSSCRRAGLGSRMTQMVVDFGKERSFSKIVLETSSTQTAAVALYEKMGFSHVLSHTETRAPAWMTVVTRVTILKMEKCIRN